MKFQVVVWFLQNEMYAFCIPLLRSNSKTFLKYWFFFTDSAFKQQRLPAWQPILTAGTVLPTFFVIGIAFIPVGIGLLYFSDEVKEMVIDYTYCNRSVATRNGYQQTNETCSSIISKDSNQECTCSITFNLDSDFKVGMFGYLKSKRNISAINSQQNNLLSVDLLFFFSFLWPLIYYYRLSAH